MLGTEAGAMLDLAHVLGKLGRWLSLQLALSVVHPLIPQWDSVNKGTSLWVPFASVLSMGSAPRASTCKLSSYKL